MQSETGNWNDVKVYYDQYSEPSYSDDKMSQEYGVFTVAGADYLTVRGIEFTTTDLAFPGVVFVKNASRHVTIDSCYVHTEMSTNYSNDVNLIYTYAKNEANQNNDYLTLRNNLLEGGYIGIRMGGTGQLKLPKEVGGVIEGNVLRNQGNKAIYCMDELGAKIRFNLIENKATDKGGFQGIDGQLRDTYGESMVIEGNTFDFDTPSYSFAINPRNLFGTASAPVLIINNEIRMKSNSSSSAPIKIGDPCENLKIAYNTIRLTGTEETAALWFNDDMKDSVSVLNNIIENETGGYVYRFYKAGGEKTVAFANNNVFTTGGVFAYNKSDIATFDDWTALSGETGSYNEKATFLSDDILEPAEEGNLRNAQPLAYVAEDITGTTRDAQKPTIGAYEYSSSTAAPVMAEGYPEVTDVTETSATLNVKADLSGTAFALVKAADLAAPTAEEVLASATKASVRKNSVAGIALGGLEKDHEYVAYAVLTSLRGTSGAVVASKKFKATSEIIVEIPNVKATATGGTVEAGNKAVLTTEITEGTAPFAIVWRNGKHAEVATTSLDALGTSETETTAAPTECDDYYLTVTDANGKQAMDTCRVIVKAEDAATATFENLYLDSESHWAGPDTKGTLVPGDWGDEMKGSFVSGSFSFSNDYNMAYGSWGGFAYSNSTATDFTIMDDQYNSAVGKGYGDSENFAVAFSNGKITVLNNEEGDSIRGLYVTNAAYALNTIKNGDSYAKKFEQGDWMNVTFTGEKADGTTSTVTYYLADFRPENEVDRYYLDTWQWVDLRPLGAVKSLSFSIDGSDKNEYGLKTPAYFCLDNFNGERVITEAATQQKGGEIDLADFFTLDDSEATVAYAFADDLADDLKDKLSLTLDGKLMVSNDAPAKFSVVISATQKGRKQFVRIPFDIASGIDGVDAEGEEAVAARYTLDGKLISKPVKGVNIVRTKDGKVVKVKN